MKKGIKKAYHKGIGPILQERLQNMHAVTAIRRSLQQPSVARGPLPLHE